MNFSLPTTFNTKSAAELTLKLTLELFRLTIGVVFIFSGFVKAIDPIGFALKISEYLDAMGGLALQLSHFSFPLAVMLSALELGVGLCFISKIHVRISSVFALLFMVFFTPLTLWLALKNPVADCGCFGDAIVISNWATFYKNVALLTMVIVVLSFQSRFRSRFTPITQNITAILFLFVGFGLSGYCYRHLPIIDFLPFKVGVNIPNDMNIPENAPKDKFETTFIYEKNGIQKEFTLENYPKNDSTWKFIDQKTVLVKEGFKAKIHDFNILNQNMEDITQQIIYNPGETYLLICGDINKAAGAGLKKAEKQYQKAIKTGTAFYVLTASSDDDIERVKSKYKLTFPFYKTDITTLNSTIRANPGLILIKDGNVINKWNWRDF